MEVFASSFIDINNVYEPEIQFDFLHENEQFGILELKTIETPITTIETLFLFSIDITGSMNEKAYGKTKKIDIVKQTFKSMIQYLSKVDAPISIRLHCFNTEVKNLLDTISIQDKENINRLYSVIDEIYADGSTNIELALNEATSYLDEYHTTNPTHQICHIFMTDGHATTGITNNDELCNLVSDTYSAVFIGFGRDHNLQLMKKMTSKVNTTYQFINDMEDTSMIYGEAIHPYLYPAVKLYRPTIVYLLFLTHTTCTFVVVL
jgi:Mg-chelatase subunit ChlD